MSCSWVNRVVLIEAGSLIQAGSLIEAGGSDTIVLIEAGASIRGNTVFAFYAFRTSHHIHLLMLELWLWPLGILFYFTLPHVRLVASSLYELSITLFVIMLLVLIWQYMTWSLSQLVVIVKCFMAPARLAIIRSLPSTTTKTIWPPTSVEFYGSTSDASDQFWYHFSTGIRSWNVFSSRSRHIGSITVQLWTKKSQWLRSVLQLSNTNDVRSTKTGANYSQKFCSGRNQ